MLFRRGTKYVAHALRGEFITSLCSLSTMATSVNMLSKRSLSRTLAVQCIKPRFVATRAVQVDVEVVDVPQRQLTSDASDGGLRRAVQAIYPATISESSMPSLTDFTETPPKVAYLDAERFRLHPSVEYWQSFNSATSVLADTEISVMDKVKELIRQASESAVLRDPQATAYWAYHTARISFFIGQAVGSLVAHHLSETLPSSLTGLAPRVTEDSSSSGSSVFSGSGHKTPLQRVFSNPIQELLNRVTEALSTFQQDYDNIRAGYYPMPWDMTPSHRQNNPLFQLARTVQSMQESTVTLQRRIRGEQDAVWLSGSLYPQYYKTFHYQTDGWLSDRSARVYEHNTELLFFGRQDAMQRTSLLPVVEFVREAGLAGLSPQNLNLLEVAAGTGRFHTFIKDTYPEMPSVVSDLSPFYLARARENLGYWRRMRQPGRALGGVDGTGVTAFLQTAVENIDSADCQYDILVCVYLFHELPDEIRRHAAAEFFRVLKPGGLAVITDSVQFGDRPQWDKTIGLFSDFNEPYYRSYVSCDLGAIFQEAGFVCDTKYLCSASKTLSFRKPAA